MEGGYEFARLDLGLDDTWSLALA